MNLKVLNFDKKIYINYNKYYYNIFIVGGFLRHLGPK